MHALRQHTFSGFDDLYCTDPPVRLLTTAGEELDHLWIDHDIPARGVLFF